MKETWQDYTISKGEWHSAEQIANNFKVNSKTVQSFAKKNKIKLVTVNKTKWHPKLDPSMNVFLDAI